MLRDNEQVLNRAPWQIDDTVDSGDATSELNSAGSSSSSGGWTVDDTVEGYGGSPPNSLTGATKDVAGGLNKGMTLNPISMAVDGINWLTTKAGLTEEGTRPPLGSDHMAELFNAIGIGTDAGDSWQGQLATDFSMSVSGGGTLGAVSKAAPAVSATLAGTEITAATASPALGRYVAPIADYYIANPIKSVAFDAIGAASMGVGGKVGGIAGEAMGGEEGRQIGENIGRAVAPALTAVGVYSAGRAGQALEDFVPMTTSGKERAAVKILEHGATNQSSKPNSASNQNPNSSNKLVNKVMGREPPPPAEPIKANNAKAPKFGEVNTGELLNDVGLIALKKNMSTSSSQSIGRASDNASTQNQSLHGGMRALDAPDADNFVQGYLSRVVRNTIQANQTKANEVILGAVQSARLSPDADLMNIERQAYQQSEALRKSARAGERKVWAPELIGTDKYYTADVTKALSKQVGEAGYWDAADDIHPLVYQLLGKKPPPHVTDADGNLALKNTEYGKVLRPTESINGLMKIRSRLMESSRQDSNRGKFYRAKLSRDAAKIVTDHITPVGGGTQALENAAIAREYSSNMHNTFSKGPVGRILGHKANGDLKVDPAVTLQKILTSGTSGRQSGRALVAAADHSQDPRQVQAMKDTISDYLTKRFVAAAMNDSTGQINTTLARNFINKNQILEDYPDIRARMSNAIEAQKLAENVGFATARRIKNIENTHIAGRYTKGEVPAQMAAVLRSPTKIKDLRILVSLAKKAKGPNGQDMSEQAMDGLKSAFYQAMKAEVAPNSGKFDAAGDALINAVRLDRFVLDNKGLIKMLYGQKGYKLLNQVRRGANINARGNSGVKSKQGINPDQHTENLVQGIGTISGVIGTKLSGKLHPLLAFGVAKRAGIKLATMLTTQNMQTVETLVEQALYDPTLYRMMTSRVTEQSVNQFLRYAVSRQVLQEATVGQNQE